MTKPKLIYDKMLGKEIISLPCHTVSKLCLIRQPSGLALLRRSDKLTVKSMIIVSLSPFGQQVFPSTPNVITKYDIYLTRRRATADLCILPTARPLTV